MCLLARLLTSGTLAVLLPGAWHNNNNNNDNNNNNNDDDDNDDDDNDDDEENDDDDDDDDNNDNNNGNGRIERRKSRFLQPPNCAANCLLHVHPSDPGVIVYRSRAAHRAFITCNPQCATWYEGTA